ncbi:hypothetical protein ACFL6R_00830 [Gemmatimonadota bacterium]
MKIVRSITMMRQTLNSIAGFCLACTFPVQQTSDLEAPFQVQANGTPIDVDYGHAAPSFVDWDGDGIKDLLVGQFDECKLRIYRNVGTEAAPGFDHYTYFHGSVPGG